MPSTRLPLSSFVLASVPTHPLPHLVLDPVLTRLATIEALVLYSKPGQILQRLGASDQTVIGLVSLLTVGVLAKWRRQWRGFMLILGVGEAVGRTLKLIERVENSSAKTTTATTTETLDDDEPESTLTREIQHLLSFWTLFFTLSFYETLRTTPSSYSKSSSLLIGKSPLTSRFRTSFRSLRYTYLRFLRLWIVPLFYRSRYAYQSLVLSHPKFDFSSRFPRFPSVPFASQFLHLLTPSSLYRPTARKASSFPQPLPAASDLSAFATMPLPHSYFASRRTTSGTAEFRWEVVKLLLLWIGSRRDVFGAKSVLFDWILGPLVKRWGGNEDENSGEGLIIYRAKHRGQGQGQGRPTFARPSQEEEEDSSRRSSHEQDVETRDSYSINNDLDDDLSFPRSPSSSTTSLSLSLSPRPSPKIWTTQTPPRPTRQRPPHSSIDLSHSLDSIQHETFPTPPPQNIPYRLTSSAHPLLNAYSTTSHQSKGTGRDSLLLESPPRLGIRRRLDQTTTTDSEEEEEDGGVGSSSPPRTEAEEGIKRWATVLSGTGELEKSEIVGLDSIGRGWSV